MAQQSPQDAAEQKRIARAKDICKAVIAKAVPGEILVEEVDHYTDWSDLRRRFNQHMIAWQYLTDMTIVTDATERLVGWRIEKRTNPASALEMPPAEADALADRLGYPMNYQSTAEIHAHVYQYVGHFHNRLAHPERGLHHFGGNATGEFILVEAETLAQQVAMRQPADAHRVVAGDRLFRHQR